MYPQPLKVEYLIRRNLLVLAQVNIFVTLTNCKVGIRSGAWSDGTTPTENVEMKQKL